MIAEVQSEPARDVGRAIGSDEGLRAMAGNTLIIPSNLSDAASFVASAMTVLERTKSGSDAQRLAKA